MTIPYPGDCGYPQQLHPCPTCGRCPTCGQPAQPFRFVPQVPVFPQPPVYPWDTTTQPIWIGDDPGRYPMTVGDGVAPLTVGDGVIPLTFGTS